jgi:hypothetical protein
MTHKDFTQPPGAPLTVFAWLVFGGLAFLCLFATAKYDTPFLLPEQGLAEAWRGANWHRLVSGEGLLIWPLLAAGFSAVLAWSRVRSMPFRLGLTLFVFLAPVILAIVTADLDKIVTWSRTLIGAPLVTPDFVFGRQDGEFYAEGHLFFVATGWWSLLWTALLARELAQWRCAVRAMPKTIEI